MTAPSAASGTLPLSAIIIPTPSQDSRAVKMRQMAPANALGVDPDWLKCVLRTVPTSGLLQQWIEAEQARNGIWEARWPQVEIEQGITEMRRIVAALR